MMPLVPKKTTAVITGQLFDELSDLLVSALEFIGAAAGWIALHDAGGGLSVAVRGGTFAEDLLPWQQDVSSVWGFAIAGEPTILNDVQPWSKLFNAPLRNLLSCPLIVNDHILGHVALANKTNGFTGHDSVVLQGLAHHMARLLDRRTRTRRAPLELPPPWQRVFDRAEEGILVLDETGELVYTNAAWLDYTGFRAEELLRRTAPFPFWVSQQDLMRASAQVTTVDDNLLPFRRCDQSLLWCRIETRTEHWNDHVVTVAFLRPTLGSHVPAGDEPSVAIARERPRPAHPPTPNWLPLVLNLDDGIEGWCPRWEEQTGMSASDVIDSRCDLVLDWLFPQQHDRDRVADCFHQPRPSGCQLILELAAAESSRPMMCTFLPMPSHLATGSARRWLLLVGQAEMVDDANAFDGSIHLNPEHTLIAPHSHSEHTTSQGEN